MDHRPARPLAGPSILLARLVTGVMATSLLAGCWSSKSTTDIPVGPTSSAPEVPDVTQTADEIRQEMKDVDPYSEQFDDSRLKLTVLLEKSRKEHGVEGFEQIETPPAAVYTSPTAIVEPASRRVAWRALGCWNPECRGQGPKGAPFLFTLEYSWITVGDDGKLIIGPPNIEEMNRPVYCPACKSNKYIKPYDFPESAAKEKKLRKELERVYKAYSAAAQEGRPKPGDLRTPEEIIKEIEALPKLFLLSEPGKVKNFDAVTSPISGGMGAVAP